MYYNAYYLHNKKPDKITKYILILWAIDLFLLVFVPAIADKLAYIPNIEGFSFKILFTPFIWGWSKQISLISLILSFATLWFFGNQVESRFSPRDFIKYLLFSNLAATILFFFLSLIFVSGVQTTASATAISITYAIWWFYQDTPLIWKNYSFGSTAYFKWFLLAGLSLNFLSEALHGYFPVFTLSMFASLGYSAWYFDHQVFLKLFRKFKRFIRKNKIGHQWGKKNGKWGYWN